MVRKTARKTPKPRKVEPSGAQAGSSAGRGKAAPPYSEAKLKALARKYGNNRELTRGERIRAYYEIGKLLPQATRKEEWGDHYGRKAVLKFRGDWETARGFRIQTTNLRLARQLATKLSVREISQVIRVGVPWTHLRELLQTRVTDRVRGRILTAVIAGRIEPRQVAAQINKALGKRSKPKRKITDPDVLLKRLTKQRDRALAAVRDYEAAAVAVLGKVEGHDADQSQEGLWKLQERVQKCAEKLGRARSK